MPRTKKTKADFPQDDKGRAILGSAKEMATWVKLGFEEQKKRSSPDDPLYREIIDLRNCVLYVSYPIGSKNPASQIFNLCDLAGVVPGIEKIEGEPDYLYEVTKDILFNGSLLYGNFCLRTVMRAGASKKIKPPDWSGGWETPACWNDSLIAS